jgi:hypothetical protein
MVDKKKTSVARLDMELYYAPENANFTYWVFVFKPMCPDPVGRPASNTAITHERMVSKGQGQDPLLFGLPVLADPEG